MRCIFRREPSTDGIGLLYYCSVLNDVSHQIEHIEPVNVKAHGHVIHVCGVDLHLVACMLLACRHLRVENLRRADLSRVTTPRAFGGVLLARFDVRVDPLEQSDLVSLLRDEVCMESTC